MEAATLSRCSRPSSDRQQPSPSVSSIRGADVSRIAARPWRWLHSPTARPAVLLCLTGISPAAKQPTLATERSPCSAAPNRRPPGGVAWARAVMGMLARCKAPSRLKPGGSRQRGLASRFRRGHLLRPGGCRRSSRALDADESIRVGRGICASQSASVRRVYLARYPSSSGYPSSSKHVADPAGRSRRCRLGRVPLAC
jgi:hypothetical protein